MKLASKDILERSADNCFQICGMLHFTTCNGYAARVVGRSLTEQAAYHHDNLRTNGPNDFTLVDRRNAVDVNAHVTCWIRT